MKQETITQSPFIPVGEAVRMTGCARSTLLKHAKTGQFCPIVSLLGERIAFVRADVQAWIDSRLQSGRAQA